MDTQKEDQLLTVSLNETQMFYLTWIAKDYGVDLSNAMRLIIRAKGLEVSRRYHAEEAASHGARHRDATER